MREWQGELRIDREEWIEKKEWENNYIQLWKRKEKEVDKIEDNIEEQEDKREGKEKARKYHWIESGEREVERIQSGKRENSRENRVGVEEKAKEW